MSFPYRASRHPDQNMPTPTRRSTMIPSVADLFFVMIFLLFSFMTPSKLLGDGDTGYHIRAGEYILETGWVPKSDIFSYHTPAIPWTAHEWLSEIIMALVHRAAGMTGIVVFFSFLLALSIYLLFKILRSYRTDMLLAVLITIMIVWSAQIHWLARPHVFSFLLMVIYQYLLETWQNGDRDRLVVLAPLMLIWVNLHGGFLGGFILMGAYLVGNAVGFLRGDAEQREKRLVKMKQLSIAIAACLGTALCNPQGYRILLFPFRLVSDTFLMDHVTEFLSPNFHDGLPFKYLLLLMVAILAVSRRTLEATELVLVLIFTNMALYSARYIPLFALVTAPILTRKADEARDIVGGRIAEFLRTRSENLARLDARASGWAWPAIAVALVAGAIASGKVTHSFSPKLKPVAATEFLRKERISGHMFNDDEFGDYLIYRAWPSYRVFFDGRSDMYGTSIMKDYFRLSNFEPDWRDILKKYRITWIFYGSNSALSRYLAREKDWVLIYSDQVANIYVKNIPQYRELIEKHKGVKQAVFDEKPAEKNSGPKGNAVKWL